MDATLILIDSDAELARARALVDRLWQSDEPADIARLQAQARLIAAYEEGKWPRRPPSTADLIRHLMDQHGLTRADMVPILGTPSRVSEVLQGKEGAEHGDGAEVARPFPRAGRLAHSAAQKRRPAARPNGPQPEFGTFGVVSPTSCGQFRALAAKRTRLSIGLRATFARHKRSRSNLSGFYPKTFSFPITRRLRRSGEYEDQPAPADRSPPCSDIPERHIPPAPRSK